MFRCLRTVYKYTVLYEWVVYAVDISEVECGCLGVVACAASNLFYLASSEEGCLNRTTFSNIGSIDSPSKSITGCICITILKGAPDKPKML